MIDFAGLGLSFNIGLFTVAAVVVWFAGTKLAEYAHQISKVTGLGQAVVGIVVLAGVTSLHEIAVTVTASIAGDSVLAVNNIFGSIALQVALLAVVDAVVGRDALTAVVPDPIVMLEGNLNMIIITLAAIAMIEPDRVLPALVHGGLDHGDRARALAAQHVEVSGRVHRLDDKVPVLAIRAPMRGRDPELTHGKLQVRSCTTLA